MQEAVISAVVRTPVGRSPRGVFKDTRPDDLAALVIETALQRVPNLAPEEVEDVILGCAIPEGPQGMNIGRIAALKAGLPHTVPAQTVNRFCSSGLQTIAQAAERIMAGFADVIIAGGVENMSMVPMDQAKLSINPELAERYPEVYTTMGITAELVAERYHISRQDQDEFALRSHQRAAAAIASGAFADEIVPVATRVARPQADGSQRFEAVTVDTDEGVRPDTSLEALGQLPSVFRQGGSVTAGNSSQTSDGAAVAVVMSREKAEAMGAPILGVFCGFSVAGVPPEVMGIGPVEAIPKVLQRTGLKLEEIDLIELNEAFAAQSIYVMRTLELDPDRVNVHGGAIALGHPLGCTGARLTATLLNEMARREARYGMVTMCIGGGMGAAGIFERV
ncbi:MAG: acetyl-CoA acetyltransferase [Candidatus Entotheonella factor]|uniref:acetyl-CoA C-acyltransferase n=1 Tax=Entotheonella factor TaxID=1429438 RepID=W4L6X1_ENTF1|nr:MAG: acetyl-CoA acetyltransferase [Candidatus Entotheonella factor]